MGSGDVDVCVENNGTTSLDVDSRCEERLSYDVDGAGNEDADAHMETVDLEESASDEPLQGQQQQQHQSGLESKCDGGALSLISESLDGAETASAGISSNIPSSIDDEQKSDSALVNT